MLVEVFTVAENMVLGREGGPLLNKDAARAKVREIGRRYGMPVDPDAVVEELPVGVQQNQQRLGLAVKTTGQQLLRTDGRRNARRWQRHLSARLKPGLRAIPFSIG